MLPLSFFFVLLAKSIVICFMSINLIVLYCIVFALRLTCDDRTMPFFAFSCGLRRVILRCSYDSTASYGFLRLPTASYHLRSLYDFVVVCTFTNFKNRKTVARRHVVGSIIVRAPYGNPAMIVRSPHGFMTIWGLK